MSPKLLTWLHDIIIISDRWSSRGILAYKLVDVQELAQREIFTNPLCLNRCLDCICITRSPCTNMSVGYIAYCRSTDQINNRTKIVDALSSSAIIGSGTGSNSPMEQGTVYTCGVYGCREWSGGRSLQ